MIRPVRWRWPILLVALAIALLYTWNLGARSFWEPDEPRYAEIGREMLVTGDWVTPRLNGFEYYEKPPLTYWSAAVCFSLFGIDEWAGRLGAVLAALSMIAATWVLGRALFGARAAWIGTLVLALSPLVWITGRLLLTDIFLSAGIAWAMAGYALALKARDRPSARTAAMVLVGAGLAVALLAKGPIGVVLPMLAIVPFRILAGREVALGAGAWAVALVVFAAIGVPWFVLISWRDPSFVWFFFVHEHLLRYTTSVAHREHGIWFYFADLLAGMFPASLLIPWAFKRGCPELRPSDPVKRGVLLLLLQAVLTFTFFTVSRSKLATYLLPAIPAFALIVGLALSELLDRLPRRAARGEERTAPGFRSGAIGAAILAAGGAVGGWLFAGAQIAQLGATMEVATMSVLLTGIALTCGAAALVRSRRAVAVCLVSSALLMTGLFAATDRLGLKLEPLFSVKPAARFVASRAVPGDVVGAYGSLLQGLNFYAGRLTTLIGTTGELAFGIAQHPGRRVLAKRDVPRLLDEQRVYIVAPSSYSEELRRLSGGRLDPVFDGARFTVFSNEPEATEGIARLRNDGPLRSAPDPPVMYARFAPPAAGRRASGQAPRAAATSTHEGTTMSTLEKIETLAEQFYRWQYSESPVRSSDSGLHDADDRLADYSPAAIARRRARLEEFQAAYAALRPDPARPDEVVDHALLGSALEREAFADTVLRRETRDPQTYVDECLGGIFSLLKKEFAPKPVRARAATARLRAMPALLAQGRENLTEPVRLYAMLAAESVDGAGPLFKESLDSLAEGTPQADVAAMHAARDEALRALGEFAAWLRQKAPSMKNDFAMGRENYARFLAKVLLLPLSPDEVVALGEAELARSRATQAWIAPAAVGAAKPKPPRDQEEFLRSYEAYTEGIVRFLKEHKVITVPPETGPFYSRQLPEAFKPTSPGGFMNAPGVFDKDPSGFYFIPTYDPKPVNFFLRAAIEDPRPILGHEGIPGHHLQISIANRNPDPVRRFHDDGVFIEGWAFYTEEMLDRCGMYDDRPDTRLQVMQLLRMRAARIAVDVRLATGEWTFEQGVDYFVKEGGLDPEAARGETAGAAAGPGYKIQYLVGKWQIERLLGRMRDREGAAFTLQGFHDRLLSYGSIPLAMVEKLMMGGSAPDAKPAAR